MVTGNELFQSPCHLVHTIIAKKFLSETKIRRLDESELCQFYDGSSSSRGKNEENFDKNSWVKVNVGQTGFYRVKYDDKLAAQLKKAIKENCLSAADNLGMY